MLRRIISMLLCMVLLFGLAACGAKEEGFSVKSPKAEETTVATEPAPTTPADGDPNDVTCKGTYSVSDGEITAAKDTVVATMEGANLTNSQLQIYYWLEVASHRASDHPDQPDYGQSLDTQPCPIDGSVNSWQQYFLQKALAAWQAQQALALMSQNEGVPAYDPEYNPDLEKRAEYMTGMPATEVLYQWSESYKPNSMHQAYLDAVPETLSTLAADSGFRDTDAMAAAIAGAGAEGRNLISYAHIANLAYMYFTEMGYYFEPTTEEVEAYYNAHQSEISSGDKTVNIRHILLIPENAEIAADGTVTASEDDWNRCRVQSQGVVDKWKAKVNKTRYSQFTLSSVPEARFSECAKDYSQDAGSAPNGGLYVHLKPGQLTPELDAWCFDEARQHGDYEIFRTDSGYRILFFSAASEGWYTEAENGLITSLYSDLVTEAMTKYPASIDYSAIRLGTAADNGSFITVSDLLYPDVAHERFPEVPLYLQQDYPEAPFGNYKVSTHGCGITTLAMVASYMADDELTPAELAARFGYYCGVRGSEIVMFDDTPAEMGFHLKKRTYSWAEMDEALKNGQIVVSLQYAGYWTGGGHYIAMTERTDDGRYVVRDSNLLNYKRRHDNHLADNHSRSSIADAGQYYWIYEPKVTSIGACARCGGGKVTPDSMLLQDYTCEKCLAATGRRNSFLNGITG